MSTRRAQGGSSTASKRIRKEINDLSRENLGALKLWPDESNILQWHALIPGPEGSAYEGGLFEVAIKIPDDYPFSPPELRFLTKVYHCNIDASGGICLDILKNSWSPALSLYKVILSLSSLLTDPNPSDPLVATIATQYRSNRSKHDATARDWVRQYAQPQKATVPPPPPPPAPVAPRPAASRTRVRRPVDASPVPQIAGTRRPAPSARGSGSAAANAIDVPSDDDDIEVLGDSSTANGVGGRSERPAKRAREGPSDSSTRSGDVIVIDD